MKKFLWILVFVVVFIALYPKTYEIDKTVTGLEIPMENPSETSPIEITIDGTYHWRWFSDDSFEGEINLDNYDITKNEIYMSVTFDGDREGEEGYGRVDYVLEKDLEAEVLEIESVGYLKMNRTGDDIIFAIFDDEGWSVGRRGTAVTYPKREYEEIERQLLFPPKRD